MAPLPAGIHRSKHDLDTIADLQKLPGLLGARGFPQLYVAFRRGPDQMDTTISPILIQDESIHQYHNAQFKIGSSILFPDRLSIQRQTLLNSK